MKTEFNKDWFEQAVQSLEQTLGVSVTIIDRQALFHSPAGRQLFAAARFTHKKLPVCACGFKQSCIDFCRHKMNSISARQETAFTKICWKGLVEIVIPLKRRDKHWGMLYTGIWKDSTVELPDDLPQELHNLRDSLPEWSAEILEETGPLIEAFAEGLLRRLDTVNALTEPVNDRNRKIRSFLEDLALSPDIRLINLA